MECDAMRPEGKYFSPRNINAWNMRDWSADTRQPDNWVYGTLDGNSQKKTATGDDELARPEYWIAKGAEAEQCGDPEALVSFTQDGTVGLTGEKKCHLALRELCELDFKLNKDKFLECTDAIEDQLSAYIKADAAYNAKTPRPTPAPTAAPTAAQ